MMKQQQKNFLFCGIGIILFLCLISTCHQEGETLDIKCSCVPDSTSASMDPPRSDEPYLLTCIYNGDLEAVKKIASQNDLDESKVPAAVEWAVNCNQPEILSWLLDNGWSANPNVYDSPLAVSCKQTCTLLKILLEHKAKLNENHEERHNVADDYKQTALHYAIQSGRPCMVKTALECGLDADPGRSYYPPLLDAVHQAHRDPQNADTICRLLVKHGADPDRAGEVFLSHEKKKINPAEYLVRNRIPLTSSLLAFFISHGADVEYTDDDLQEMVSPEDVIENSDPLLKKRPHLRMELLRQYLLQICSVPEQFNDENYNNALLKALQEIDIDLNHPLPGQRETPLALAEKNGNKKLSELLIRYGAKPAQ